jgi:hypothetical protein
MTDAAQMSSRPLQSLAIAFFLLISLASANPAAAANATGHGALALAAILGQYDPSLGPRTKAGLLRLLADKSYGRTGTLTVDMAEATCRAGDVDLKAFNCALTYGTGTINLKGRQAAELYATLAEAGIPSDGAAGTIYESAKSISCNLNLTELGGPGTGDGGGAGCTYQPQ